jgi:DNA polymerase-4
MSSRILHVDLDAFFVEVCRQRHPELRGVELLVVGGRRDQRGVVQSASYGARRFGIHAGMPIAQAVRLCPQATFFQGAFPHYRTASRAVRRVLEDFSPTVVMASLDEA